VTAVGCGLFKVTDGRIDDAPDPGTPPRTADRPVTLRAGDGMRD
jgi:hypothetical protein